MTPPSTSNATGEPSPPWLEKYYEATRQHTVSLVKAAVDCLVQDEQTVTIEAISQQSQRLDPLGKGVKKAGILGNAEAYAYYRQHSTARRRAVERKARLPRRSAAAHYPFPTDLHRDLQQARHHYLRESKHDLVECLVTVGRPMLNHNSSSLACNLWSSNSSKRYKRGKKTPLFDPLAVPE